MLNVNWNNIYKCSGECPVHISKIAFAIEGHERGREFHQGGAGEAKRGVGWAEWRYWGN